MKTINILILIFSFLNFITTKKLISVVVIVRHGARNPIASLNYY